MRKRNYLLYLFIVYIFEKINKNQIVHIFTLNKILFKMKLKKSISSIIKFRKEKYSKII